MSFSPGDAGYLYFAYPFGLVLIGLLLFSLYELWKSIASLKWRPVLVSSIEFAIDEDSDNDNRTTYTPKARYSYTFRTRGYSSRKLTYRPFDFYSYARAKRAIDRLARARGYYAWVNPKNPRQSVLVAGPNLWSFLVPTILITALSWVHSGINQHLVSVAA